VAGFIIGDVETWGSAITVIIRLSMNCDIAVTN